MSMFAKEFYLESNPDNRYREVLPKYRHINAKLECLYRDSLIGVSLEPGVLSELVVKDYLDELSFLSETAGGVVKKRFVQKLDSPNSKTFVGSGKISEIQIYKFS